MSIAEKLVTIAENQQMVYDAGYAKGQAEGGGSYEEGYNAAIEEVCPVFEETGEAIMCFPMSGHPFTVASSENVNVTHCGKNLFNKAAQADNTDGNSYAATNCIPGGTSFTSTSGRSIVVSVKPNTTYTVNHNLPTTMRLGTSIDYPSVGGAVSKYKTRSGSALEPVTITTGANDRWMVIQLLINADINNNGYTREDCIESLQIEIGNDATPYKEYNGNTFTVGAGETVEIEPLDGVNCLIADNGTITASDRLNASAMYEYIKGL